MDALTLEQGTQLCRVLADPTRLRLLMLLEFQELTVAEMTQVTQLAQSRVSTHLGRLREAGLVVDRRNGTSVHYSIDTDSIPEAAQFLWGALRKNVEDAQVERDRERAREIVRARQLRQTWAESVAGRMESHYSPGRTWEATARALIGLLALGDVLDCGSGDGVLAELLSHQARSVSCLDVSATVVRAGRQRLSRLGNVRFFQGDMHTLPFAGARFDQVFLMHTLTFTRRPQAVINESARVLKPGGRIVVTTLRRHPHEATVAAYDHLNLGFEATQVDSMLGEAGLQVEQSEVTSREPRPPYFEVITAQARQPEA